MSTTTKSRAKCSSCGKAIAFDASLEGRSAKCPSCGTLTKLVSDEPKPVDQKPSATYADPPATGIAAQLDGIFRSTRRRQDMRLDCPLCHERESMRARRMSTRSGGQTVIGVLVFCAALLAMSTYGPIMLFVAAAGIYAAVGVRNVWRCGHCAHWQERD